VVEDSESLEDSVLPVPPDLELLLFPPDLELLLFPPDLELLPFPLLLLVGNLSTGARVGASVELFATGKAEGALVEAATTGSAEGLLVDVAAGTGAVVGLPVWGAMVGDETGVVVGLSLDAVCTGTLISVKSFPKMRIKSTAMVPGRGAVIPSGVKRPPHALTPEDPEEPPHPELPTPLLELPMPLLPPELLEELPEVKPPPTATFNKKKCGLWSSSQSTQFSGSMSMSQIMKSSTYVLIRVGVQSIL
jgi:hypothetical protein